MRTRNIFLLFALFLGIGACQPEDPNELMSQERAIISYFINGVQIGPADITRTTSKAEMTIYVIEGMDLSNVTPVIEVSHGASISPASGEAIDLSSGSFTYKVTAQGGLTRDWTLTVQPFENLIHGKWYVGKPMQFFYHIGPGEDWGWSDTKALENNMPTVAPASDNTLELTTTGIDGNGNLVGTGSYDAGEDGMYESFIYSSDCNGQVDYTPFYGRMPQGAFNWVLDLNEDKLILTTDNNEEYSLPLEWDADENSENPYTVFRLPFAPEAHVLGWQDCTYNELELNYGQKTWYTFVKEGYTLPGDTGGPGNEPIIPSYSPISLNGSWGITEIGFWPSGDAGICADFDNIMTFSNEFYDETSGILSGDFTYTAGADGELTNVQDVDGDWVVFPTAGSFELKVLQDPLDTESRQYWTMKYIATDGTEVVVDNPVEGSGNDQIVLKFNGGQLSDGNATDAHWYKFGRGHVGENPCLAPAPDEFLTGNWGAHSATSAIYEYTDNHYPVAGTEATLDDTYSFSDVTVSDDGRTWTGTITVDHGADGETFDAGDYTLKTGTFTYVYQSTDEWGGVIGTFTLNVDGKEISYTESKRYGDESYYDFQIKFPHEASQWGDMYYRLTKK
ncbi:hypothetical protein [Sediminitomix flava]|uniref:Uncharacterized protein n=1 Tax=Sediminitomix flava TaxID=379075 RepID=A0A315ZEM0_SEDFL|nr:hypothetical protein [Sediminitomix flava]PWJ43164.1 hypothetical protein BC781_102713 [Sediminitomix flava]